MIRYTLYDGVRGRGSVQKYHVDAPSEYSAPSKILKHVPVYTYGMEIHAPNMPSTQTIKKFAPYAVVPAVGVMTFLSLPVAPPQPGPPSISREQPKTSSTHSDTSTRTDEARVDTTSTPDMEDSQQTPLRSNPPASVEEYTPRDQGTAVIDRVSGTVESFQPTQAVGGVGGRGSGVLEPVVSQLAPPVPTRDTITEVPVQSTLIAAEPVVKQVEVIAESPESKPSAPPPMEEDVPSPPVDLLVVDNVKHPPTPPANPGKAKDVVIPPKPERPVLPDEASLKAVDMINGVIIGGARK